MAKQQVDTALPIEFYEVCEVVYQSLAGTNGKSLTGCFAQAIVQGGIFDPTYVGVKDRLSNFRGYHLIDVDGIYQIASTGTGYIWISRDRGSSWQNILSNSYSSGICITEAGKNVIITLTSASYISISTDYADTWSSVATPAIFEDVYASETTQYITGVQLNGYIYVSSDFGATWTQKTSLGLLGVIECVISSSGEFQLVATQDLSLYRSADFGATFTAISIVDYAWNSVIMSKDGKYQGALSNNGSSNSSLWMSSNFGVTWAKKALTTSNWTNVGMSGDGKYLTVGHFSQKMYRSIDYGVTWTITNSALSVTSVHPALSSTGKYQTVGINGSYLSVSSDYGLNWGISTIPGTNQYYGIEMSR